MSKTASTFKTLNHIGLPAAHNRGARLALLLVLIGMVAFFAAPLRAQTVTFAGAQSTVPLPVSFSASGGVAVDKAGDIFVLDPSAANPVIELPAGGGAPIIIGTGLLRPEGIAADGAGDVFIADTGNGRVVEVPAGGGNQIVVASTFSFPVGVAVDAAGDVFVADSRLNQVFEVPAGFASCCASVGTGLTTPEGVAVDTAGDVFIADTGNTRVVEVPAGCTACQTTVGILQAAPVGVAVDAGGDVFIAIPGASQVAEVPASGTQTTVGSGFISPNAVAVDGSGDVFITDSENGQLFEVQTSANFGDINVCPAGQTTPAPCTESATLFYNVSANATLLGPVVTTQGAANLDFTLGTGSTCTGAVTVGTPCTVNATFTPQVPGVRKGAVQITDANANVLATTLISGTGLAPQVALLPGLLSTIQSATANFGVYGVAVDASGTIYYSDQLGGKVFKIVNGVTATLPFTGLMAPQQLAVDGAGSVYLLDGGARIMKLDTNGVQSTLVSSANFPFGLTVITSFAVGGQGGVYMTGPSVDFGGLVAKLGAGGDFGLIGSDFADLQALALGPGTTVYVVDFIANSGTSTLYSITPTGAQDTVATGLPVISSIAVDAGGAVYLPENSEVPPFDAGNLLVIDSQGGQTTYAVPGLDISTQLAMDNNGSLYFANVIGIQQDSPSGNILKIDRTQTTLNFGSIPVGNTSAPQSAAVSNIGNQPLVFSGLTVPAEFLQQPPATGTACSGALTLALGTDCQIALAFAPNVLGEVTDTSTLTDNSLNNNASNQTISLQGTGTGVVPVSLTLTGPTAGVAGGTGTYTVTELGADGLPATGDSNTVVLAKVTGAQSETDFAVLLTNGVGTFGLEFIASPANAVTVYTITATDRANSSLTATPLTLTVSPAPARTTLTLTANPASDSFVGQLVTLTATLAAATGGVTTTNGETITFKNNNVTLGTGTLTGGVATFTTTTLPAGSNALSAVYSGDANFAASTSTFLVYGVFSPAATNTGLAITAGGKEATTVASGTVVTLTASVNTRDALVSPGLVKFCDATAPRCEDSALLGTAQLTVSGTATFKFIPGIGAHSYNAVFAGTHSYKTSASPIQQLTVTGLYPTTTAIAATGTPGNYTLTGTVVGTGSSVVSPTGVLSFLDTNDGLSVGTANLGAGTLAQTFAAQVPYGTGTNPESVAVGDFNGDGIPDMVVANFLSNTVSVLLGQPGGTFQAQVTYATGVGPESVAVGDFNGDGVLDLAVANSNDNTVGVLLGKGNGTFSPQATYATGGGPNSVAVGDFNGDGIPDLAVANFGRGSGNTVSVLLGNGDGTFSPQAAYGTGNEPISVAVGDFNGDGFLDLAVANSGDNTVSVLLGKGDGTFNTEVPYATGGQPYSVAVADFKGDGSPDLVLSDYSNSGIAVLLGKGDGTFNPQASYPTGTNPMSVTVGDFNGDGVADVATANGNANTVSVLLGKGDGTFNPQVAYATLGGPFFVAVGDFNGDGVTDLAVADAGAASVSVLLSSLTETATATATNVSIAGSGTHNVEASYPGATNFGPSTSTTVPLQGSGLSMPTITSLSPNTAVAGSAATVVTITGTQFLSGAAVTVNGTSQAATFVSVTQLTTTLTAAQLSTVGTLTLAVVNSDGGTSNTATFTVALVPVQVTPTSVNFGDQTVGATSAAQAITVTNNQANALTIVFIGINVGINLSDFAETNNCPATLASGASCQISVTFTPIGIGQKLAYLQIDNDAQSQSVTLTGIGTGGILQVNPGNLKTIAGNGTAGYSGDGGAATAAELTQPSGIAFDAQGNLYIADEGNNVVRKVDTAGNITTVAGNGTAGYGGDGGPATGAELNSPWGVAIDPAGDLYIADTGNALVRKVDLAGTITTYAGNGQFGFSGDGGPATNAEFSDIFNLRSDAAGNLYVPDCDNGAIRKINTGGIITTVAGTGTPGFSGDGGPATSAQLGCPAGVAIDAAGDIFIADFGDSRIRKVNANGIISTVAGNGTAGFSGDGGPAVSAELDTPIDVDLDSAGNVYIADDENNRVRKIDTGGIITTFAGGLNNAGSAGVDSPLGLTMDPSANLYFSDSGNEAVREVYPAGIPVFPATPVNTAAAAETVTLSNIGNLPVTIASQASFALSGNTADFSLVGGTCLAGSVILAPNGGTCALQIGFTPTATGTRTLTVAVTDNALYSPQSFQVSGTGTVPSLAGVTPTISPTGVTAGSGDTTITVSGANFTPTSVVNFNGTPLVTTFVSASQLTAVIPAALLATAATVQVTVSDVASDSTSQAATFTILPTVSATLTAPPTANPGDQMQSQVTFQLQQPYPQDINGTLTLSFTPDPGNPAENPQLRFSSDSTYTCNTTGTTCTFTLPANTTTIPAVMLQVGTISGTITITPQLASNGVNITSATLQPVTIVVSRAAPTITALSFSASGNTLTVLVTGYSSTREIQSATFYFTPASGASLNQKTLTVPATALFQTWYTNNDSVQFGSTFTYTQLFTLSGPATAVGGVGVTLTNTVGTSTEATSP